jgi:hypothetical protein
LKFQQKFAGSKEIDRVRLSEPIVFPLSKQENSKMKKIIAIFVFVMLAAVAAQAQMTLAQTLEAKEKKAWEEFGKGDGKWFDKFLTKDAMLVSEWGINDKAQTVKDISSKPCEIKSFKFNNFKVISLNPTTAVAVYEAEQDATCMGQPAPKKVYASSVYTKVGNDWFGAFHQESTAMEMPMPKP